eukprot:SM000197S05455  [mRNA]  locus=s197:234279:235791:+ [translate_table: standard]
MSRPRLWRVRLAKLAPIAGPASSTAPPPATWLCSSDLEPLTLSLLSRPDSATSTLTIVGGSYTYEHHYISDITLLRPRINSTAATIPPSAAGWTEQSRMLLMRYCLTGYRDGLGARRCMIRFDDCTAADECFKLIHVCITWSTAISHDVCKLLWTDDSAMTREPDLHLILLMSHVQETRLVESAGTDMRRWHTTRQLQIKPTSQSARPAAEAPTGFWDAQPAERNISDNRTTDLDSGRTCHMPLLSRPNRRAPTEPSLQACLLDPQFAELLQRVEATWLELEVQLADEIRAISHYSDSTQGRGDPLCPRPLSLETAIFVPFT